MSVDQELFTDRLPVYLTRFIGRQVEIDQLTDLLGSTRLVTICGVGGAGKSRLAIETAGRWRATGSADPGRGAVYWVPLATVTDPSTVPSTVAAAISPAEASSRDALVALVDALVDQQALLVLDNCEQVAQACGELVTQLLAQCPALTVLATSRTALQRGEERVFAIPLLRRGAGSGSARGEAVELFVDRAASVTPGYARTEADARLIGAICDRLEGLPLAIELAASWVRVLSARDLLAQLDDDSPFSSANAAVAERHRGLGGVLDSCWHWLGEEDRRVLTALGVFVGGFSREAAEAVAGATLSSLSSLVAHALIQRLPDALGGTRYHVHELVRSSAMERLLEGDDSVAGAIRQRHCDFYVGLLEALDARHRADPELEPFAQLGDDDANVHAAMRWALAGGDGERAVRMAACLYRLGAHGWSPRLTRSVLEESLDLRASVTSIKGRHALAQALAHSAQAALEILDVDPARGRLVDALALHEQLGDHDGVGSALRGLGYLSRQTGDLDAAQDYAMRSLVLCQATGDRIGILWSDVDVGDCALARGDLDEARRRYVDVLARFEVVNQPFGVCYTRIQLGTVHRRRAAYPAALQLYRLALESQQAQSASHGSTLLENVGAVAAAVHEPVQAATLLGAAESWRSRHRAPRAPTSEPDFRRARTLARRQLDRGAWDAATAAGQRLRPAQAVDYARDATERLIAKLEAQPAGLTEREAEVLKLVAAGLSNAAIAERLTVSPRTVNAHLRSIFTKLGVTSRTAAVHRAAPFHLV